MIDRSKTRDIPLHPSAVKGRSNDWNLCRGNHLGQRSCANATIGRTYGRKRSDQSTAQQLARSGPSTYGWTQVCPHGKAQNPRRDAMTTYVLISGTLFREPEQRTSKAGKPFVTATLKATARTRSFGASLPSPKPLNRSYCASMRAIPFLSKGRSRPRSTRRRA